MTLSMFGLIQACPSYETDARIQAPQSVYKFGVATQANQPLVERFIPLDKVILRDQSKRRAYLLPIIGQILNLPVGRPVHSEANSLRFQKNTKFVQVCNFLRADLGTKKSGGGLKSEQLFHHKPTQSFAHWSPANAKSLGEIKFVQLFVGFNLVTKNEFAKFIIGTADDRSAADICIYFSGRLPPHTTPLFLIKCSANAHRLP